MDKAPPLLVTIEGYAVEGGYDRPFEPATNYSPTIALGRHRGPAEAAGLWVDYESVIDLVASMHLGGIRLSVEWARIEPRRGQVDWAALERYARVVRHARALGLGVTVVLFDAAWPSWLGLEAWLMPWTVPYVLAHARRVGEKVANDVTGMVVFADPQRLSEGGFVRAQCPPWRRGALEDARYARRQIAGVEDELSRDPVLGPLLVRSSREISLDLTPGEISALRDRSAHVDEVYVRSLVRGCGPTAVARGLLERDGAGWRIALSDELLEVLR